MANAPQNPAPTREAPWLAWLRRTQRSLADGTARVGDADRRVAEPADGHEQAFHAA